MKLTLSVTTLINDFNVLLVARRAPCINDMIGR